MIRQKIEPKKERLRFAPTEISKYRFIKVNICPDCNNIVSRANIWDDNKKIFNYEDNWFYCDCCKGFILTKNCNKKEVKQMKVLFKTSDKRKASIWVRA